MIEFPETEKPNEQEQAAATDAARFVTHAKDGACEWQASVEGMHCASCALRIEEELNKEPGVDAHVNLATRRLSVRWTGDASRASGFVSKIAALGYKALPFGDDQAEDSERREEKTLLRATIVAGVASVLVMALSAGEFSVARALGGNEASRDFMRWLAACISVPAVVLAGMPFFRSAWSALRHRSTNMDVPISVALILTVGMSLFETAQGGSFAYFDSATMLLFLLLVGRYLARRTRGRARGAAQDLLQMMSGSASVVDSGQLRTLPIRELRAGMLIHVAAGEKIAADGAVETGISEVDPSVITGETVPQRVAPGARVFGGMVNLQAPITVRLTAVSGDSLLGEVIRLMEKAEQGHAVFVRLADRVARIYTPAVHALALITFVAWHFVFLRAWQPSLLAAMTVLIITCPCAMGLAVPAVQVLTSGRLFRKGMLIKSADALERMARVDTVVFDKTGTLTEGKPHLANPAAIGSRNMQIAASLAAHSQHPLARALSDLYGGKIIDCAVEEIAGQGMQTRMDGKQVRLGRRDWCGDEAAPADDSPELWLNVEGETPVRFVFSDALRRDAEATLAELKRRGYRLVLLSGDRASAVSAVAKTLGLEEVQARMTPVDKAKRIEDLRAQGCRVLMVGDGLNDAPALASADVSMSPSSALDIAQNAADIVFQGNRLAPVAEALAVAKKAETLVRQNFVLSFVYNAFAVPLAMFGLVTPMIAAVAMSGSSILVVLNAQRITEKSN